MFISHTKLVGTRHAYRGVMLIRSILIKRVDCILNVLGFSEENQDSEALRSNSTFLSSQLPFHSPSLRYLSYFMPSSFLPFRIPIEGVAIGLGKYKGLQANGVWCRRSQTGVSETTHNLTPPANTPKERKVIHYRIALLKALLPPWTKLITLVKVVNCF